MPGLLISMTDCEQLWVRYPSVWAGVLRTAIRRAVVDPWRADAALALTDAQVNTEQAAMFASLRAECLAALALSGDGTASLDPKVAARCLPT